MMFVIWSRALGSVTHTFACTRDYPKFLIGTIDRKDEQYHVKKKHMWSIVILEIIPLKQVFRKKYLDLSIIQFIAILLAFPSWFLRSHVPNCDQVSITILILLQLHLRQATPLGKGWESASLESEWWFRWIFIIFRCNFSLNDQVRWILTQNWQSMKIYAIVHQTCPAPSQIANRKGEDTSAPQHKISNRSATHTMANGPYYISMNQQFSSLFMAAGDHPLWSMALIKKFPGFQGSITSKWRGER